MAAVSTLIPGGDKLGEEMALPDWLQTVMTFVGGGVGIKGVDFALARFNKRDDLEASLRKELRDENVALKAEVDRLEAEIVAEKGRMEGFVKRTQSTLSAAEKVDGENRLLRDQNAELTAQNAALMTQNRLLIAQNGQLSAEAAQLASDLRALQAWFAQIRTKNRPGAPR